MSDRDHSTVYRPEYAELARKFCRLGATNDELAECFEVARSPIDAWLKTEPDFAAGVRRGRAIADAAVAERLFDCAMGYSHQATKVVAVRGEAVTVRYTVTLPPEVEACIAWLRDRRNWSAKEGQAATDEVRPSQPAERIEPAPPAYNGYNAYNSETAFNPLKEKAFPNGIIGQSGWPEIVRNGLKFPSDGQSCALGTNGRNGRKSETSLKALKYNDLLGRIPAIPGMVGIGRNGCNYLATPRALSGAPMSNVT